MKNKLVTIIIPAYNVSKYIEKCTLSALNQTHQNIEVIVVNDGSKDKTKEILDNLAKEHKNLTVIHKENEGVSAARNDGLKIAKGDYVVFLDGDDYLSEDYVSYMLKLVKETDADFCMSKNCFMTTDQNQEEEHIEILTPAEATTLLLSPKINVGCWNKIYKRKLLQENNLNFSTELFYGEGLHFITRVAQRTNKLGVGTRRVYNYRQDNEDSATTKFNIKKFYNGEKSILKIKDEMILVDKEVLKMWEVHYCLFAMHAMIATLDNIKKEYKKDYKRWRKYIRQNFYKVLNTKIELKTKLKLIIACISPRFITIRTKYKRMKDFKKSV